MLYQKDAEKALLSGYETSSSDPEQAPASGSSQSSPTSVRKLIIVGALSVASLFAFFAAVPDISVPSCMHSMHANQSDQRNAAENGRIDPGKVFLNIPSTDRLRENL
ncbi:hypothetical protein GGI12_003419, partial [Dipsacomyces acuminosporus]